MKRKFFSIVTVLTFALVGCQGYNQEGQMNDNNTIQPTRSNDAGDRVNQGRNDTMDRDGDRFGDNRSNMTTRENRTDVRTRDEADERNDRYEDSRYEVAEKAADEITRKIEEIDQAYVLTTNNNAYVAATLDNDRNNRNNRNNDNNDTTNRNMENNNQNTNVRNVEQGEELTEDIKEEISDIVKSVDNNIDNVFVSTNPDFYDLTNNYVDDVNNDRPVRGLFDQMGNMIERLFPQNR
ncbi:MAG TPA: YhcN/YlaJ family sporulation lipoprotein [Bacillota bacterium]